jgi:hypothetical protein
MRRRHVRRAATRNHGIDDGISEWKKFPLKRAEYHALLTGLIVTNRADRLDLWAVISAQVENGHSMSSKYLRFALRASNTTALRVMLEIGWQIHGPVSVFLNNPLRLILSLERATKDRLPRHIPYPWEVQALDIDQDLPDIPGPVLQTHRNIYAQYNTKRMNQCAERYLVSLKECETLLRSYGARMPAIVKLLSPPLQSVEHVQYLRMARAWAYIFYALLYAAAIPVIVIYNTTDVWTTMTLGQKFGFMILWAALVCGIPPNVFFHKSKASTRTGHGVIYATFAILVIVNHFVLPFLIIHVNWRPFLSCKHSVNECQLVSDCTNYSFLLPLVAAVFELNFSLALALLGSFLDLW